MPICSRVRALSPVLMRKFTHLSILYLQANLLTSVNASCERKYTPKVNRKAMIRNNICLWTKFEPVYSFLTCFRVIRLILCQWLWPHFKVSTGLRMASFRQSKFASETGQILLPISIWVCQMFSDWMDISLRQAKQMIKFWWLWPHCVSK